MRSAAYAPCAAHSIRHTRPAVRRVLDTRRSFIARLDIGECTASAYLTASVYLTGSRSRTHLAVKGPGQARSSRARCAGAARARRLCEHGGECMRAARTRGRMPARDFGRVRTKTRRFGPCDDAAEQTAQAQAHRRSPALPWGRRGRGRRRNGRREEGREEGREGGREGGRETGRAAPTLM